MTHIFRALNVASLSAQPHAGLGGGGGFERLHYQLESFFDCDGEVNPAFLKVGVATLTFKLTTASCTTFSCQLWQSTKEAMSSKPRVSSYMNLLFPIDPSRLSRPSPLRPAFCETAKPPLPAVSIPQRSCQRYTLLNHYAGSFQQTLTCSRIISKVPKQAPLSHNLIFS